MADEIRVRVDVRTFSATNVIDTCAIWNLLSSPRLLAAARERSGWFVVPGYVRYEALDQRRTAPTATELEMQAELRARLERNQGFSEQPVSVGDLLAIANLEGVRRLGRGEIAALALARRMRAALLTDDQEARRRAPATGVSPVQTIPHLLGWLVYNGVLTDGDVQTVISQHQQRIPVSKGWLTKFFRTMHEEACGLRLAEALDMAGE